MNARCEIFEGEVGLSVATPILAEVFLFARLMDGSECRNEFRRTNDPSVSVADARACLSPPQGTALEPVLSPTGAGGKYILLFLGRRKLHMQKEINVSIALIVDNPYQPRKADDAEHIERLARSIAVDGLLQTPKARAMPDGTYQLAFGHSRRKAFEWLAENAERLDLPTGYNGYLQMPLIVVPLNDREMYRAALAENVQRKDLNPIEVALAMKTYMEEFSATSDEAGELFGVSGSTVRGKVRLLELPAVVQQKLIGGEITEGLARLMINMSKLVTDEDLLLALEEINDNPNDAPEYTVQNFIERRDNVKEMWSDERGKKAMSSWRGGFALDLKKFPKEYIEDPESVVMNADTGCVTCPLYARVNGSHYCGKKACLEIKTAAWHKHILEKTSKKTGIEIYDAKRDGKYRLLDCHSPSDKKAFAKTHSDLRLMLAEDAKGYSYQSDLDNVDTDMLRVVMTGDLMKKQEQAAAPADADDEDLEELYESVMTPEERRSDLLEDAFTALEWEIGRAIGKKLFADMGANMVQALHACASWKVHAHYAPDEMTFANDAERAMSQMGASLLRDAINATDDDVDFEDIHTATALLGYFTAAMKTLGLAKLPKAVTHVAETYDEKIAALGVAAETEAG
jgi:ParB/RepB/Spo0J family partition protein